MKKFLYILLYAGLVILYSVDLRHAVQDFSKEILITNKKPDIMKLNKNINNITQICITAKPDNVNKNFSRISATNQTDNALAVAKKKHNVTTSSTWTPSKYLSAS